MPRKPDLAFEKLAEVTHSNIEMERGRLNTAIKAIRIAWGREGGLEEDLPREIELRAKAYGEFMPGMALTPTALAVHWHRVMAQRTTKTAQQQALEDLRKET